MLTKESFVKGIKDMRAVFGINPDKETLEIWFRHLSKLDDKYFLAGISLLAEHEEAFYPNTNIVFKIKEYAQRAREKELALIEQVPEQWQLERRRVIEEQYKRVQEETYKKLIEDKPYLREYVEKLFLPQKKGVKLLE